MITYNGEVINCPLGLLLQNVITRFNVLGLLNKKRYICVGSTASRSIQNSVVAVLKNLLNLLTRQAYDLGGLGVFCL